MSSFGYITQVLAADVANNATVAVSYPTGQTRASLGATSSGDLTVDNGRGGAFDEGATGFTLSYGASTITVTNKSGITWLSGSEIRLSFGENAPRGSYEAQVNGYGGAAQAARFLQRFTASGAAVPGESVIELDHISVAAAVTLLVVPNTLLIIKNNSASGTAGHTVTLTGGTYNGTNTIATFAVAANGQQLVVYFDSKGNGQIVSNAGTVALS